MGAGQMGGGGTMASGATHASGGTMVDAAAGVEALFPELEGVSIDARGTARVSTGAKGVGGERVYRGRQ